MENPVEIMVQTIDLFNKSFPYIIGADVAGIVEAVGEGVTHLEKGQRVLGYCMGLGVDDSAFGAYQLYPKVHASLVAPFPDSVTFEQASVLPLAITTVAVNLYHPDHLGLQLPSLSPTPSGKTLFVWGGSSSVGSTAIQLAVASGFEVVATASLQNHGLVESLGAAVVLDHKSPDIVDEAIATLSQREVVAVFDAISTPATMKPLDAILDKVGPLKVGVVVPPAMPLSKNFQPTMSLAFEILNEKGRDVLQAVWGEFVPKAIASGRLQFKPDPVVVGKGLEGLQDGLDKLKGGVSARKYVVQICDDRVFPKE
ncbi:hypothetical protein FALCPG4_014876 [Fusarium falciforme]